MITMTIECSKLNAKNKYEIINISNDMNMSINRAKSISNDISGDKMHQSVIMECSRLKAKINSNNQILIARNVSNIR